MIYDEWSSRTEQRFNLSGVCELTCGTANSLGSRYEEAILFVLAHAGKTATACPSPEVRLNLTSNILPSVNDEAS